MSRQSLASAERELQIATEAVDAMTKAASFTAFERAWKEFLGAIEKAWKKMEAACIARDEKKTKSWRDHLVNFRRTDWLLQYLNQARDADHHSVEELVVHDPGEYSFELDERKPGATHGGGSIVIHEMHQDASGRVSKYRGTHVPRIVDRPAHFRLLPVTNRGATFAIPTEHLDVPIGPRYGDALFAAQLGLKFYRDTLNEAREQFFS